MCVCVRVWHNRRSGGWVMVGVSVLFELLHAVINE